MESIFNRDFYPTPIDVIEKMLIGVDISGKIILEPSAGSGNIVDYLNSRGAKKSSRAKRSRNYAVHWAANATLLRMIF